jgi:hypothetical protein
MCDNRQGFGLDIGFIDHLQFVTTNNYNIIAKSFPARSVFTSSCLVTASNNDYTSTSGLKSSLKGGSFSTACFLLQLSSL